MIYACSECIDHFSLETRIASSNACCEICETIKKDETYKFVILVPRVPRFEVLNFLETNMPDELKAYQTRLRDIDGRNK